jgi:hypothetical protein
MTKFVHDEIVEANGSTLAAFDNLIVPFDVELHGWSRQRSSWSVMEKEVGASANGSRVASAKVAKVDSQVSFLLRRANVEPAESEIRAFVELLLDNAFSFGPRVRVALSCRVEANVSLCRGPKVPELVDARCGAAGFCALATVCRQSGRTHQRASECPFWKRVLAPPVGQRSASRSDVFDVPSFHVTVLSMTLRSRGWIPLLHGRIHELHERAEG